MRDVSEHSTLEQETAADALRDGLRSAKEALAYVKLLVSTTLDRWKLSVVMLGVYAVLGIFGAAAGIAVVVTAVILLLVGIAHGLGALLGGRDWLGDLIVGFLLLAGLTFGIAAFLGRFVSASRRKTLKKYQVQHNYQRQEFGHDVNDRSKSTVNPHAN